MHGPEESVHRPDRVQQRDPFTAPTHDILVKRKDGKVRLLDCARTFIAMPSPRLLLGALAIALGLRLAQGGWTWRDAVLAAGVLSVTPFVEWLIHVYLLHCPPLNLFGVRIELPSAREHRAHHAEPSLLHEVLLPVYGVLTFLPMIALVNWALSFPVHLVLRGHRLAYAGTGMLISFAILTAYEWTHYLIHCPYRPKSRYFKAIWRNHRLHHFKNERYWFGVTSTIGDIVIGTAPDQRSVQRSATARRLHPTS